jgi:hypothetical protein
MLLNFLLLELFESEIAHALPQPLLEGKFTSSTLLPFFFFSLWVRILTLLFGFGISAVSFSVKSE